MPCSCGNTNCPCGIPCCCSEESCKCQTCAIALSSFCKICNKPLITEGQTDVDKCSCFIRESTALIFENRNNPRFRMGSMPMPVGYFVSGKLMVNVMIPVPVLNFPQLIPQQPVCLMPPPPSIQVDSGNIFPSFISDENVINPSSTEENSGSLSTAELHQILNKSSEESRNPTYRLEPSANICIKGAQNTKISCQEACPSLESLQSTNENQSVNIVQNTKSKIKECEEFSSTESHQLLDKSNEQSGNHPSTSISLNASTTNENACPAPESSQSVDKNQIVNTAPNKKLETEEHANIQEPSLYLPSITIGNISHPVGLADPIWRLSNPAFCSAGNYDSSLKLYNPFYVSELVNVTETVATHKKDSCLLIPVLNFEGNSTQCFTKNADNVQTDSTISLQKNRQPLDPTKIMEQSNVVTNGEYVEFAVSSNGAEGSECVVPTTLVGQSNHLQVFPTNGIAHQMLGNTLPEASNDQWQQGTWWDNFSQFSLPTAPVTQYIQENLIPSQTSGFQNMFTPSNNKNKERNEYLLSDNNLFVSEMNRRNNEDSALHNSIPLYLDPSTTQKMEKLLKSALRLNVNSPTSSEKSS
ncbi:uncharacterized protein LOC129981443 [Argiope bruennichi]|uniref:uncharacterized protein LOC129981443 n=1 Tax=Argiope bruennichi TaxID=94029 RepID=UPI002494D4FB|nr:uncharacterized protein LOC129981443 [Argiope bruennichi]